MTVCPLLTVPALAVYVPPSIAYSPPLTVIAAAALIPATVTAFEVTVALRVTPVCAVKLKLSGVVSDGAASVVTLNAPATPPIVTVALVVVA